jgi:hypothetical protein
MQITSTGVISLPAVTISMIDADTTGKAIVTKEYINTSNYWTKTGDVIRNNNTGNIEFFNANNYVTPTGSAKFGNIQGSYITASVMFQLPNAGYLSCDGSGNNYFKGFRNSHWLSDIKLKYLSDFSSTYDDRTLVDRGYITSYTTTQLAGKMNNPSLTVNFIPKALTATTIGNSQIRNEGNNIQIKNTELFPNASYDISLGFDSNKTIAIEDSDNSVIGRSLNINAGRAINFSKSNNFIDTNIIGNSTLLAINLNDNSIYSTSGNNIIKSVENSNIFNIVGTIPTGIISDISIDYINNDVWVITAPATTGNPPNIYKQSLGSGAFVLQTFTGLSNINNAGGTISLFINSITKDLFYVAGTSIGGDGFIYKKSSGNTVFSLYDNTITCTSYTKIKVNTVNNDILLFYSGATGSTQYLYKQSLGSGAFNLIFSSGVSAGSTPFLFSFDVSNTNNNIYTISGGQLGNTLSIFKQTGGSGSFISQTFSGTKSVSYNYQIQTSIVIDNKGDVYGSVNNNIIYKQTNFSAGTPDLQGGTLKLNSGTGKGTGSSDIEMWTGQVLTSGTTMQTATLRAKIDNTGLMTLPSVTNALITADATGKAVVTKEYLIATLVITLYIAGSGNDSTAIPNNSNYPYASFTAVFNYINTLSSDNFKIILLDPVSQTSNARIPNKNIAIYGSSLGGATALSFNTTTLSNASVIDNSPNITGNKKLVQLEMYNITILLSTGQSFRNENCMLICENFSVTSSSNLTSFAYSAGLILFNSISGGFNTITISSGANTYGGVIGTSSGIIRIKSLVVNATGQYFAREFLNRSVQFHIQSISGTGSITLSILSKPIFYLYNITINGTVTLTNQGDNDNIFIFNNSTISGSTIVSAGEGYGYVTGSINDSSTNGITLPGFLRTGSIMIFKDFKGVVTPSIVYPTASSEIHFINCNIKFTGTYLIKLNSAINNNLIKFIGVNTFVQTVAGDLLDSNGTSFQIEKRGVIYTNSTSLGTGVTVDNKTPNTY